MNETYTALLGRVRDISKLNSVSVLLGWDQELHMPPGGGQYRAEQLALLSSLEHQRSTSTEIGEMLMRLAQELEQNQLPPEVVVNIRETRRDYERKRKLSSELVEDIARTRSQAMQAWRDARAKSKFTIFQPWLEKHLDLQKQAADSFGYHLEPYDALLDEYEPGMTAAQLEPIFRQLGAAIVPMVNQIVRSSAPTDRTIFSRCYPVEKQKEWARMLVAAAGFSLESGRLDTCTHAFTETVCIDDVRLTARCNENDPLALTYSLMHEVGHGLYEQGFERRHQGTPMGRAISLGLHESQARLWENIIGRSPAFWKFAFPRFKSIFAGIADDLDEATAYRCANEVRPTLRRIGSDEITYNLHVLMRFELERKLINGTLRVSELPDAWNASMQEYLGLTPPDDAQGVLQDVHWSMYYVGYFPTYVLGNLYAAQIHEAAQHDLRDLDAQIACGEFHHLREWLREKIHRHGMRYQAAELVELVSGNPPSSEAFLRYLQRKFLGPDTPVDQANASP